MFDRVIERWHKGESKCVATLARSAHQQAESDMTTKRQALVLAALHSGSMDPELSPVQAQKLFFLIDRNAPHLCSGPWFAFAPYDYGPFDSNVYSELDWLSHEGDIEIVRNGRYRTYRLTDSGRRKAAEALSTFPPAAQEYFGKAKDWVKSLGFRDLVSAIYKAYPEMRAKSIFQG